MGKGWWRGYDGGVGADVRKVKEVKERWFWGGGR